MKPSLALATHRIEIREIVLAHRAVNARVFGSVVHGLDTDLSDLDIQRYVDSGEPMGKAGAYAIQGLAAAHIVRIQGSYTGIMGLPLYETA